MTQAATTLNEKNAVGTEEADPQDVLDILTKHNENRGGLIAILEEIQTRCGYLPEDALKTVAEKTGRSLVDIYGVATFYHSFSLAPRGKHLVSVCVGTACHVRGAPVIAEEFERQLEVGPGETTPDREFTLQTVNCLGACALGPMVVVDGHYFSNVKPTKVAEIIASTREGLDKIEVETDERVFPLELHCPHCNHSLMDPTHLIDGLPSIRLTVSFENQHCNFNLSCLYGSFNSESQIDIPMHTVLNFFCPHCDAELAGASNCTECGAPMVPMVVRTGGGMVQVCSRQGCKAHRLDLEDVHV